MIIDIKNLPLDAKSTHAIIVALSKKNALFLVEIQSLKDQLALLKAQRFGKSSEKLNKQISELESKIEDNEIEASKDCRYDTESVNKDRQKPENTISKLNET